MKEKSNQDTIDLIESIKELMRILIVFQIYETP